MSDEDRTKVQCRVCKQEINEGARICIHCGSPQSRVRRLSTGLVPVLSLLIALISIIAGSGKDIALIFSEPSPKIIPAVKSVKGANLTMEFLNDGTASGVANEIRCSAEPFYANDIEARLEFQFDPQQKKFIRPGGVEEYVYYLSSARRKAPAERQSGAISLFSTAEACCGAPNVSCSLSISSGQNTVDVSFEPADLSAWLSKIERDVIDVQDFCKSDMPPRNCWGGEFKWPIEP